MKNFFSFKNIRSMVLCVALYVLIQALMTTGILPIGYHSTVMTICIFIILAVSLNLITGFTGQFSLGHAGFMSIGAYTSTILLKTFGNDQMFLIAIFGGAVMAALVGFAIGIPTLRLKGDYLAIATLGFGEIIKVIFLNMEITGGAKGLTVMQHTNWTWMFLFTAATVIIINNFIHSAPGRACISIREDEIAAEAMGVNTTKYKVMAFVVGAFFAGIAGALHAHYFYFIDPKWFGFLKSIDILVIVVLGGLGSISGSILAAILVAIVNLYLQAFPEIRMILYALLLVCVMIFRPQGLMGSKELSFELFRKFDPFRSKKNAKVE